MDDLFSNVVAELIAKGIIVFGIPFLFKALGLAWNIFLVLLKIAGILFLISLFASLICN